MTESESTGVLEGDMRRVLRELDAESIDSCVCDPPYELNFMGRAWDRSGIAFQAETWSEVLRVLKPGGHLIAMGGSRTFHRLACAIEDAGFELRDTLAWLYGSGFPKSLDVSKAIDKAAGAEREILEERPAFGIGGNGCLNGHAEGATYKIDSGPVTDAAKQWFGWGTALKPAMELCVLARKPLSEATVAANVLKWGTGALNISSTRIMTEDQERDADVYKRLSSLCYVSGIRELSASCARDTLRRIASALRSYSTGGKAPSHNGGASDDSLLDREQYAHLVARLYPNESWCGRSDWLVPDYLFDCPTCRHFGGEHARLLQEAAQGGAPLLADALERTYKEQLEPVYNHDCQCNVRLSSALIALSMLAGEYCNIYLATPINARWPANVAHDGSDEVVGLFPQSKAGTQTQIRGTGGIWSGESNTPCGPQYGDEGSAARFFYCAKASASERAGSKHPTVKPLALMRWLVRLVTPPGGLVLDPFAGSGSTGEAALSEGFRAVLIEHEHEYVIDIERRLERAKKAQGVSLDEVMG